MYQEVRAFGDTVQETGSVYYGARATCILPVLYALLGASAYLLRARGWALAGGDPGASARYIAKLVATRESR